jgi:hypothetical protein
LTWASCPQDIIGYLTLIVPAVLKIDYTISQTLLFHAILSKIASFLASGVAPILNVLNMATKSKSKAIGLAIMALFWLTTATQPHRWPIDAERVL